MNSFEKGRRRVAVSLLPVIAQTLDTTLDALVVDSTTPAMKSAPRKREPAPKIQQQLERVTALPTSEQRVIAQVLDSMLGHSSG